MPTRFEVERAVLASDLPMTSKCLMLVLAAWTDNGTAAIRPEHRKSLTEIARAAGAGRSTVARGLDRLETDGWIVRRRPTETQRKAGGKTGYRLLIPAVGSPVAGLGVVPERDYLPGGSPSAGLLATSGNAGGSPRAGRGVVPERDGKAITKENHSKHLAESFGRFWNTYPRKVGKRTAETAFERACKRAAADKIIDGAERYRDDPNREKRYTAHPTTWLNRDGWDDDALPPPDSGSLNGHPGRGQVSNEDEWMVNRS